MRVKMIFVMQDGTRLQGAQYCDIDDAGGDFRGDAWGELAAAARQAGLTEIKLSKVELEYSEPQDMTSLLE